MRKVLLIGVLIAWSCSACDVKSPDNTATEDGVQVNDEIYTFGRWVVKDGQEDAFVEAWVALGDFFYALDEPPGKGTLVQSSSDPQLFYSFGPWPSAEAVSAMRANPRSREELDKLVELCDEAEPGMFRVVAVTEPKPREGR